MADKDATPVLDLLGNMTAASLDASAMDPALLIQVRFAALVAMDASPATYLFHLGAGAEAGLTLDDVQQVLIALAPLVGSARVVSASTKVARALGLAIALADEPDRRPVAAHGTA
jgi:alkylhydroperoxidase/carboxymuconolactone decarboxylase family protein YurZ